MLDGLSARTLRPIIEPHLHPDEQVLERALGQARSGASLFPGLPPFRAKVAICATDRRLIIVWQAGKPGTEPKVVMSMYDWGQVSRVELGCGYLTKTLTIAARGERRAFVIARWLGPQNFASAAGLVLCWSVQRALRRGLGWARSSAHVLLQQ